MDENFEKLKNDNNIKIAEDGKMCNAWLFLNIADFAKGPLVIVIIAQRYLVQRNFEKLKHGKSGTV